MITIVIPTRNRIKALEAVWPSYLVHPGVSRIVVVDDGSTDGTEQRVRELANHTVVPVTIVRHDNQRGQPQSRRSGIAIADTEWVLFGEDDVWLATDYCAVLLRDARLLDASIIAGRLVTARISGEFNASQLLDPPPARQFSGSVFDFEQMDADFSVTTAAPVPAPFLHSIALIRRDVFSQVTFDTWYAGNSWREETDFYLAANACGARAFFSPNTVCFHLRGPISATGGHRMNRLLFEYRAWRNTRHLVSKHWKYLERSHGLRGSPTSWMLRYYARRQIGQLRRVVTHGIRSTYDG